MRAEPVWSADERCGQVSRGLARLGADRGEGVRVLLLRHQRARAAVRIGELDEPELLTGVDLEVLADLALVRRRDRERREELDIDIRLPGRILRMLDQPLAAKEARRAGVRSSDQREPALPPAPATLSPRAACKRPSPIGVPQCGVGVCQEQVADGRGLGGLEVGVVGRERVSRRRERVARARRPRR